MALYTFESPRTKQRLFHKTVVVDASYLVALSDATDNHFPIVAPLHFQLKSGTYFLINLVARQEFIKKIRSNLLINALLHLASDPAVEARYSHIAGINPAKSLNTANLGAHLDRLFKDHVRNGDTKQLLDALSTDIWFQTQRLEKQANMSYQEASGTTWDNVGRVIQLTGLAPADAMIANFALAVGADAILTTDCDFACLASIIDVYTPVAVAKGCVVYNPTID